MRWFKGQPQAGNVKDRDKVSLIRSPGKQERQKMDVAGAVGAVFTIGVVKKLCHDTRKTADYKKKTSKLRFPD